MSTLTVSALRTRVATALAGLSGWTESRHPPGLFGRDTDSLLPGAFSVDVEDTSTHSGDGRQRISEGAYVSTTVTVRWAHRLRGDAPVSDYGAALDAEASAVVAVLGVSRADLHLTYVSSVRDTSQEGWLIGGIRFRALHRLALS